MSDILDYYQQQAQSGVSQIPWLAQLQSKALTDLKRRGFPTRYDEEWKYTLVDSLLQQHFVLPDPTVNPALKTAFDDSPVKNLFLIQNGFISQEQEWIKNLPEGVLILPLSLALINYADLVKPYLGKL